MISIISIISMISMISMISILSKSGRLATDHQGGSRRFGFGPLGPNPECWMPGWKVKSEKSGEGKPGAGHGQSLRRGGRAEGATAGGVWCTMKVCQR